MSAGRILAVAGALVAVAAIGAGLWVIGPPAAQRDVRLDERREQDMERLAAAVRAHWRIEKALPSDLATLAAAPGSTLPTRDPGTGEPYEYVVVDADRFRLCAVFATDTAADRARRAESFRDHGRGRHCFDERGDDD